MEGVLFTTKEVARYLKINEKKVYQLVKEGSIPCTRVAGKWLFPKDLIDEWIAENVQTQRDLLIAGSNDPFLEFLIKKYNRTYDLESLAYYASIGSAGGLEALKKHKAVMAASHLFDPETKTYNLPFLPKYLGDMEVVVVNLTYRQQGFIVKKGNPLGLKDFSDLVSKGARLINRNLGSGTRLLLDYYLTQLSIDPSQIKGYDQEVNTHLEVGLSILKDEADVGIGIKYVADVLGLDFIPITWERFDLIVKKDDYYLKPIKRFLSLLDPLNLSLYTTKFLGYNFKETGKVLFK